MKPSGWPAISARTGSAGRQYSRRPFRATQPIVLYVKQQLIDGHIVYPRNWRPNADEWLYYISVKRRALVRRVFAEALEWERRGLTPGD
jgi:hypothetical protein